ncbi:DUF4915 domain-containing protein [Nostoc sp.]|uniref:DUF4915 domain-containing protein n=1 Tax=Nostoc sp. TaxID=1180 RepID=UPI002FF715B7
MKSFLLGSNAMPSSSGTKSGIACSRDFLCYLQSQFLSLAFTIYQTNWLFLINCNFQGRVTAKKRLFDKQMGRYVLNNSIYTSTYYQIWRLENLLVPGKIYQQSVDALVKPLVPLLLSKLARASLTGEKKQLVVRYRPYIPRPPTPLATCNVYDLMLDIAGNIIFVNTDFSCLATIGNDYSFVPLCQPPFISKLLAEDDCYLNGYRNSPLQTAPAVTMLGSP